MHQQIITMYVKIVILLQLICRIIHVKHVMVVALKIVPVVTVAHFYIIMNVFQQIVVQVNFFIFYFYLVIYIDLNFFLIRWNLC